MSRLLHISASPRGEASESLRIANTFLSAYREANGHREIETWARPVEPCLSAT